jgi:two-component system, cell cycle sensor histidine kinase and response regulator CckA
MEPPGTANTNSGTVNCRIFETVKGWQVLLKMKEENPDVRVVVASGYLEPKMKAEMACAGVRHFVNKPYRLNQILEMIQGLVEKR